MTSLDWAAANERLRQAREAMEARRSPEEARRVLDERARALARPQGGGDAGPEATEVLVFALAGERCAIEARHVLEAFALGRPTPVPCTPRFVLGVVNHRGRVLPVIDVNALLGLRAEPEPEPRHAIAVQADGLVFGIAAAEVEQAAPYALGALSPHPEVRHSAVRGVTSDLVTVFNLDSLAADPWLQIDDGVTR